MAKKGGNINSKKLIDVLIYVIFASVLLPIIASQVADMEGDTGNFSASEILLLGLITTFIVIGVVYAIIKTLL